MKKCKQCRQNQSDDVKFCANCGGSEFEPAFEEGAYQGAYQQPAYQQPGYQQAAYQQPVYQQPYQQPVYDNTQPATVGNYIVFFLLMLIPIFNLIYMIIVAVGSPTRNKSMTNYARACLIMAAIGIAITIILSIVLGATLFSVFRDGFDYSYSYGF